MGSDLETRIRHVTAVLGPTNTGKTHLAIERMIGHESGMIGLPLRLLAREVYDKIATRVGADKVALITGEEKIKPERARFWVCTVEAMPRDVDVDFLAIDEIQLAGDPERGHVFTDRLLHARGRSETLLLGAQTMRETIADLIPGANFISRPRLSKLSYSGQKKITRLPQRTAVVAFSAAEVYSIAELVRRQRGGAAVVIGALSPRTRNAQVALYQSGDVDFLVATDAIGMGLNLDVDHVAFSATRKFDGQNHRNLTPCGAEPDCRPCRSPHERRHLRRHRLGGPIRLRHDRAARDAQLRKCACAAVAQPRSRFAHARRLKAVAARDAEHPAAGACALRR